MCFIPNVIQNGSGLLTRLDSRKKRTGFLGPMQAGRAKKEKPTY